MICDKCGRATDYSASTTFPNSEIVICSRAGCESVANQAKLLYYEREIDDLKAELGL